MGNTILCSQNNQFFYTGNIGVGAVNIVLETPSQVWPGTYYRGGNCSHDLLLWLIEATSNLAPDGRSMLSILCMQTRFSLCFPHEWLKFDKWQSLARWEFRGRQVCVRLWPIPSAFEVIVWEGSGVCEEMQRLMELKTHQVGGVSPSLHGSLRDQGSTLRPALSPNKLSNSRLEWAWAAPPLNFIHSHHYRGALLLPKVIYAEAFVPQSEHLYMTTDKTWAATWHGVGM